MCRTLAVPGEVGFRGRTLHGDEALNSGGMSPAGW